MLKKERYLLLIIGAFLLFILSFLISAANLVDVNVYDTYFVVASKTIYCSFSIFLTFLFMIYWSLDKGKIQMIALLSKIHIHGTLISILGVVFPYSLVLQNSNFPLYDNMLKVNFCTTISALLFLFLQILFIINIFVSIIKKLGHSATK